MTESLPEREALDLDVDHGFGTWHYCAFDRTLGCHAGDQAAKIHLEKIVSSAQMLDAISRQQKRYGGIPGVVPSAATGLFRRNSCAGRDEGRPAGAGRNRTTT